MPEPKGKPNYTALSLENQSRKILFLTCMVKMMSYIRQRCSTYRTLYHDGKDLHSCFIKAHKGETFDSEKREMPATATNKLQRPYDWRE